MTSWPPRARDLTLAWLACLLPRVIIAIALHGQIELDTSSTAIVDGVFTSDLHTPMWPPFYQVFAESAWRLSGGWVPAFVALHLAAHALVGAAVLLLAARLGLSRRTGWIAVVGCALLPYLLGASVRHLDVGVCVSIAALTAAAIARGTPAAGWWAGAWFLARPESLIAIAGLAAWRWLATDVAGRRHVIRGAAVFALVVLGWSTANAVRFGRFTPLPSNAGANFAIGYRPGIAERLADRSFNPPLDPVIDDSSPDIGGSLYDIDAAAAALAWRRIRADPAGALALVPLKFARYWDWTLGGNVPHSQAEQWAYTIPYLVLLVLGSLGVVRLWRDGHRSALAFLLIVMAGYMLPHLAVFGLIRMRMSVEWALILVGAAAMGELRWSSPHAVGSATRLAR